MEPLRIGSEEHGRLFCDTFIQTHRPFEARDIVWPDLDEESLARLKSLPVWDEAARTEAATAVKVQTLGETETDPILKEAIALQGYEEGRHAEIINLLRAQLRPGDDVLIKGSLAMGMSAVVRGIRAEGEL